MWPRDLSVLVGGLLASLLTLSVLARDSALATELAVLPARASERTPAERPDRDLRASHLATWKTVTLGTYKDATELRRRLDMAGFKIGTLAEELIARRGLSFTNEPVRVDLVVASVAELGFASGATHAAISARARQLGLALCRAEIDLILRLNYRDQPLGEFLYIAMEPIATRSGELAALTLGNGGNGLLLIGGDASPRTTFDPTARFVFVRPGAAPAAATAVARRQSAP